MVAQLVRRAEGAGFKAIALTVDTPRLGRRESDIKNRSSSVTHGLDVVYSFLKGSVLEPSFSCKLYLLYSRFYPMILDI